MADNIVPQVLNPYSGEIALNMKQLIDDNQEHARRRASNDSDFDKWSNGFNQRVSEFNQRVAEDAQVVKHLAQLNVLASAQTGQTENQQTVSPIRTGTGDAIAAVPGVAAGMVSMSGGDLAQLIAQTVAAVVPIVVNASGGASTPSQTKPAA